MRVLTTVAVMTAMVLVACSATMNFIFVSSLGKTPIEAYVLGAVSVAVDILKALLAVFVAKAARSSRWTFVVIGGMAFIVFSSASMIAATGFASANRGMATAGRMTEHSQLLAARQHRDDVGKKRDHLPQHRTVAIIEEALAGRRIDLRWSTSKKCASPITASQREFCAGTSELRVELVTAREGERLEQMLSAIESDIARLERSGAAGASDPQARILAETFGLDEARVQRLLMTLIALVVELSSGLGMYLATGHAGSGSAGVSLSPTLSAVCGAQHAENTERVTLSKSVVPPTSVCAPELHATEIELRPMKRRRSGRDKSHVSISLVAAKPASD